MRRLWRTCARMSEYRRLLPRQKKAHRFPVRFFCAGDVACNPEESAGRAASAATASIASQIDFRGDREAVGRHIDLDGLGAVDQVLFHQKGVPADDVNTVGISLLIQSKSKLWPPSAGCHVHPDGRSVFSLKIIIQLLFRGRRQFEHNNQSSK